MLENHYPQTILLNYVQEPFTISMINRLISIGTVQEAVQYGLNISCRLLAADRHVINPRVALQWGNPKISETVNVLTLLLYGRLILRILLWTYKRFILSNAFSLRESEKPSFVFIRPVFDGILGDNFLQANSLVLIMDERELLL